mgnify:CR=1 FL=1
MDIRGNRTKRKKDNVVVTGGTGFLGKAVCKELEAR